MRATLFPFQEAALADLHECIKDAHNAWSEKKPQVISFSASTGAGKTIIMTALFEDIIFGHAFGVAEPDSVFVWLSDMPELNEQTRMKIESKSEKFRTRDVRVIDSTFDAEYFAGGGIYFLNTQKLGSDKLLTGKGDGRQYTIWETLANTAKRQPRSLYVVIDEAHRGTANQQAANKAQSIMQKFVKGSKEDGMPIMPLVIGMTATPQRFDALVAGTTSTVQKVIVPPEDVRDSGLLKDRIILHYPEDVSIDTKMTMLRQAVVNWKRKCDRWSAYCEQEEMKTVVRPVLVVQVEDAAEGKITQTDLSECLRVIEDVLGRKPRVGEVVQTFDGKDTITIDEFDIRKIEASRIEDDETAAVVFFKMNLSTGWDCPRAETMMSFRHANDYTYIAQLLGRMIRTPLARRVESDAELNNVSLFLPHFDEETVNLVHEALQNSEAIVPAETGSDRELITLTRDLAFADVFENMDLITYRLDAGRKQPALRRLIGLARALTQDMIAPGARKTALKKVLVEFDKEIASLRESGKFADIEKSITGLALRTLTIEYGSDLAGFAEDSPEVVPLSDLDLTNLFERAGKTLGEGLHKEYWSVNGTRDATEVMTEIIVLASDFAAVDRIETCADKLFSEMYDEYQSAFRNLKEERKDVYKKLAQSSSTPIALAWELPQTIDFSVAADSVVLDKHLYIPTEGGVFKVSLNDWELGVVKEEIKNGAVAWLRNLDRKKWSLEISYDVSGVATSMFPDLVIVRATAHGYVFDVLEPHDPSRKDNYPKAVGLAKFAENHGERFGRIQLIRKDHGHFYRLDMGKLTIRNKVRGITSNSELDRIFEEDAVLEE